MLDFIETIAEVLVLGMSFFQGVNETKLICIRERTIWQRKNLGHWEMTFCMLHS
ncbi:MAG: hypothetical protein RLY14_3241 [Planctomycetota bacterium]|jgi:hypothetical protein